MRTTKFWGKLYNSFWANFFFSFCEYCTFYNISKLSISRLVLTHHAFKGGLLALRDGDVHHRVLDLRRPAGVHWEIWQSRWRWRWRKLCAICRDYNKQCDYILMWISLHLHILGIVTSHKGNSLATTCLADFSGVVSRLCGRPFTSHTPLCNLFL